MSKNKTRTKDKYRVVYTDTQRIELENEFRLNEYIAIPRKQEIAQKLKLSDRQIKIWFQNRRAKKRKQQKRKQSAVVAPHSRTHCVREPEMLDRRVSLGSSEIELDRAIRAEQPTHQADHQADQQADPQIIRSTNETNQQANRQSNHTSNNRAHAPASHFGQSQKNCIYYATPPTAVPETTSGSDSQCYCCCCYAATTTTTTTTTTVNDYDYETNSNTNYRHSNFPLHNSATSQTENQYYFNYDPAVPGATSLTNVIHTGNPLGEQSIYH